MLQIPELMADVAEVNDIEMKKRKFDGHLDDRLQEMLPIKLKVWSHTFLLFLKVVTEQSVSIVLARQIANE